MSRKGIYSGTVLTLASIQLIESVAVGLPLSYFPQYVLGLGGTIASIGLFTSTFSLAAAVMSTQLGMLSDKYGRKRLIMLGIVGDVIWGTLTGLAPSWIWLLFIRIVNGAVSSAAMISAEAFLIDTVDPQRRGEATGFVMSMSMVGHQLGPLFGGLIQYASVTLGTDLITSYRIPYFADSILAGIALVLVAWKLQEPKKTIHAGMQVGGAGKVPLSFEFKIMLIGAFATGVGFGFAMPIMVLFYADKFGLQPVEIGMLTSLFGLVGFFASWYAGRLADKIGRMIIIGVGGLSSRISDFFLPITDNVFQAAGLAGIRSLAGSISMPAMRALRADISPPERRGRYFGMFNTAMTAGMIAGPIFGTYLYENFRYTDFSLGPVTLPGYGIPFFINSILGIATTLMLVILVKDPTRQKTRPVTPPRTQTTEDDP